MKSKKMPDQQLAGTRMSADAALAIIGSDPATLVLAIQLMDRIISRRGKSKSRRLTKYDLTR